MKTRNLWVAAVVLLTGGSAMALPARPISTISLEEMTAPWLKLLRSGEPAVRAAAASTLVDIVRKHPSAAAEVVEWMANEENGGVSAEHERCLVPLAKESPATVSALIRAIRDSKTNYRARNFGVKVLSQVGPAAATSEFVEALAEKYCPVPGAFIRVMRALGTDATPILTAGFRHPNGVIRERATIALRVIGRTNPVVQKVFDALQAEGPLVQKVRTGTPAERISAIAALSELARTTPGTATVLVKTMNDVTDKEVLAAAEVHLVALGRESPETVAALVAGVRSDDDYRLRKLALKVLPKVGSLLNCKAVVDALGDDSCPVPGAMERILLAAGADALPVLAVAQKHSNRMVREAADTILKAMPRPVVLGVGVTP